MNSQALVDSEAGYFLVLVKCKGKRTKEVKKEPFAEEEEKPIAVGVGRTSRSR